MDEPVSSGLDAADAASQFSRRGFVQRLVGGTSVTLTGGVGQVSRLIAGAALGPLLGTAGAQGAVNTVVANGDTTLDQAAPTSNFGSDPILQVDVRSGFVRDVLLTFDPADIGLYLPAATAQLRVQVVMDSLPTGETITLQACSTNDTESTATWATTAVGSGPVAIGAYEPSSNVLTFDVVTLVNSLASAFRLTRTSLAPDGGVALMPRDQFAVIVPPQLVISTAPMVSATPTPSPSPTPTPTPSASSSPAPSSTPSASPTATPTPTFTPTPTPTPTSSITPSPTPTPTPTPTPSESATPTPTPTPTPSASATPAPTPTPTPSASATPAPTPTPTPSASFTPPPTPTPTPTASFTPPPTPTPSPSGSRRVPGEPGTLNYVALPTGQVQLSWSRPVTGARAVDYVLFGGSSPGASDLLTLEVRGGATQVTTDSSVPSGDYYVRVRGRNRSGMGPASNELLLRLGVPANTPPAAPGVLAATVDGQRVSLSWGAAAGATSYLIEIGVTPGGPYTKRNIGALLQFDVTAPAGTFYLRVRGLNQAGEGLPSNEVVVQTVGDLVAPGVPENLAATVLGDSVTLSWSTPSSGGPVDDYVVDVGRTPTAIEFSVTSVSEQLFAPGTPAGVYFVRVRARNVIGDGPPTAILQVNVF